MRRVAGRCACSLAIKKIDDVMRLLDTRAGPGKENCVKEPVRTNENGVKKKGGGV